MGRGDIKTKKGKIKAGSFGKARPAKIATKIATKTATKTAAPKAPKETEVAEKKPSAKKAK